MSLRGISLRIIVSEPIDWPHKNVFAEIISDRGGKKLIVKTGTPIKGKKITSDLLELVPREDGELQEYFRPLLRQSTVFIEASLIKEDSDEKEYILSGTCTPD